MITPMMMKVDFTSIRNVGRRPAGLAVTWRSTGWLSRSPWHCSRGCFFALVFAHWIAPAEADQYIAGCIVLAAAPCTAIVFVWSHLTGGDAAYTLVQVAVNDLIMLVAFVPSSGCLVTGASSLQVPFGVLLWSVIVFIVIPLAAGTLLRWRLVKSQGLAWFERPLLPRFAPLTISALLATAGLRPDEVAPSSAYGSVAGRADRRQQLLRTGSRDDDRAVRCGFGGSARHGCGCACGGSGDAIGLRRLQSHRALV